MKKQIGQALICLSLLFLTGCVGKPAERMEGTTLKTKTCAAFQFVYDKNSYEVISGEKGNKKILTMADRTKEGAEGISVLVTADPSILDGRRPPESLREAKLYLVEASTAKQGVTYAQTDTYFVETAYDYATDGNYAYFTIFAIPKNSENDPVVYSLKFVYGETFYPSNSLFQSCMRALGNLIGLVPKISYQDTMSKLKNLYDEVNNDGREMRYNYNADEAQTYEPQLVNGAYTLDGSEFDFLDVGEDSNCVQEGTYVLSVVTGSGVYNQTDSSLMPKQAFDLSRTSGEKEVLLETGDRIYVDKNLTVKLIVEGK